MSDRPERDQLASEFRRERHIRRTVMVLETKRQRIRQELEQFLVHLNFLIPDTDKYSRGDFLSEAIARLDDEAFAELLAEMFQEHK